MKKLFLILFLLIPGYSFCQTFNFVYADPTFMEKNSKPRTAGLPLDEFVLRPNMLDGMYVMFYDERQTKVSQKGFIKAGHRVTSWAYYYENQKAHWEMSYDDSGNITGIVHEYFENGTPKSETEYKNGTRNGMSVTYNDKGKTSYVCSYKDGILNGKAITYKEDGTPSKTEVYSNGKLINTSTHSMPEGK